jgi:hypothetical protein
MNPIIKRNLFERTSFFFPIYPADQTNAGKKAEENAYNDATGSRWNGNCFYSKPLKNIAPLYKIIFASLKNQMRDLTMTGTMIANKNFIIQAKGAISLSGAYIFKSGKVENL